MNEEITIKERQSVDISVSLVLSKFKVALSKLERVVSSRSTLPILNNILIKAHKGGVELMATDLEIGVKFNIGGKVEREGVITIPGRTLINLMNNIHSDTVTLTTKNNIVSVVAGEVKANLNGVPADDFPVIPEVEGGKSVNLPAGLFKEWLNQVDFAASTEESRPVLTGVYLSSDGNKLTLAATDSYRLSEMVVNEKLGESFNVLIPARTLGEVKRMIDDGDKLELRVGDNQVMFVFEQAILVSRLIEGEYPNYKQIIPDKHSTRVELDVQELADTLKTASIFSLEGSSGVRLSVKPSGTIEVTSESSQLGNFSAKLPAKVEGEGGEISFNAKYLLDGLNSFETPRCIFEMESKTTPGVFKPSGVEGRLYIVMPLRN